MAPSPPATPVTTPLAEPMVAIVGALVVHEPPEVISAKVIV